MLVWLVICLHKLVCVCVLLSGERTGASGKGEEVIANSEERRRVLQGME